MFALYVGINKPHKNLVRLVQAWGKLGSGAQGWELVLAGGEDPRYKQARHEAARLGLPVHFPGSIAEEDLPALYNAAGIFVLPSTYEGFGLPVLEAMACGTPVLCSNTSSLPEIAGNAALYISPEDTDGIAKVLRCLIGDALLRAELSEKGRRQASRFSWERAARETLAVYRFALL
jgi:alpha-1,3-rhamnosyl/mannosyltransferase